MEPQPAPNAHLPMQQTLQAWVGMTAMQVLFDSDVDEFVAETVGPKILGRDHLAVVGILPTGDVFGAAFSLPIPQSDEMVYDPSMFAFSFQSNGRCLTPQRFLVCPEWRHESCLQFYANDKRGFFQFWVWLKSCFWLGCETSNCFNFNLDNCFETLEERTLTGMNYDCEPPFYHCARLMVVQLH